MSIARSSEDVIGSIDDLLLQILLCLPVKPLIRLKLVSKHWESLITTHFLRNRSRGPVGLICPGHKVIPLFDYIPLDVTNPTEPPFRLLRFRGETVTYPYWIQQSCNGLLLCCSSFNRSIHNEYQCSWHSMRSCNPTTKCFAQIPMRPDGYPRRVVLGVNLAFDPVVSLGYKVVCVRGSKFARDELVQIEIYSSDSGEWRVSGEPFTATAKFNYGVYWNGSIHWISYRQPTELLYFNVDQEKLGNVSLPPTISGGYETVQKSIGYFGESCDHLHIVESNCGEQMAIFNVYEMKRDYSEWFVRYRVDVTMTNIIVNELMNIIRDGSSILSLIRVDEGKGSSFLVLHARGKVLRYNLDCNTFEEISVDIGNVVVEYKLPRAFEHIELFAGV